MQDVSHARDRREGGGCKAVAKAYQRVVPNGVPAIRRMSSNRRGVVKNQSM